MPIVARHIFVYNNLWLLYVIIYNQWLFVNALFLNSIFILNIILLRCFMQFRTDRLIELRKEQGITRAEAARRLNMSAMGYGRYEKGERTPSYQTVSYIAHEFGTTADYLYGISDDKKPISIIIYSSDNPELFSFVRTVQQANEQMLKRLIAYADLLEKKADSKK